MTQSCPEDAGWVVAGCYMGNAVFFNSLAELNFAASFLVEFFSLHRFISLNELGGRAGISTGTGERRGTVCRSRAALGGSIAVVFVAFWAGSGRGRTGGGPGRALFPRFVPALRSRAFGRVGGAWRSGQWERRPRAIRAMAEAGGGGGAELAECGDGDGGGDPALAAAPGRAQLFTTVVDTFLEKLVAAGR